MTIGENQIHAIIRPEGGPSYTSLMFYHLTHVVSSATQGPHKIDQSVENAGVEFVKGADERNKFFEKINKQ